MKGLKVLPANSEDFDYIKTCQHKTYSEIFGTNEELWPGIRHDKANFQSHLLSKFSTNPFQILVLFQNDNRIGIIILEDCLSESTTGHVELYYLEKAFRGKGIGLFMESVAIRYFEQQGAKELSVSVVQSNHRAVNYFTKMGYKFSELASADSGLRTAKKEITQRGSELYLQAHQFLNRLTAEAQSLKIQLDDLEFDHICFRTVDDKHYLETCSKFAEIGELLIESLVNLRPISTYKLQHPVLFRGRTIDLIEVTSPKKDKITISGFEHIEVILKNDFQAFINMHPHIEFNQENQNKEKNPEIQIQLQSGAIKFHLLSLMNIVELERNSFINELIRDLDFHNLLKEFKPTVVGTFPLALTTSSSDIDVICYAQNIELCIEQIKKFFVIEQRFNCEVSTNEGYAEFTKEGVKIEFFVSSILPVYQAGLRHLVIENLLLKIAPQFRSEILQLKLDGTKTEPAFAQVLKIPGDAYSELLKMDTLSESELRRGYGLSIF